ncbi:MAG: hypothetical protein BSOLF_0833 [Candidatus Carbobacillus altaicus]|uniref:Uncharacterized protein n=1 Tax=Candidatus Carbonibacillus altaicus TaxID=2163959 RepID=A0A2R6Y087_9BACL|nr:MAG: hypothetical protein BSOLF_0833 [Candidatus Carbobacillus altaicus]
MDEALVDLAHAEEDFLHARERLKAARERFYREVVRVCAPCDRITSTRKVADVCPSCPVWEKKQTIIADLAEARAEYIDAKNRVRVWTAALLAVWR